MTPQRPSNIHPLTVELLELLQNHPEASEIVIGGGVALSHYSQHRDTFDLDAWWKSHPKRETIELIRSVMKQIAQAHGTFEELQWGDVISFNIKESDGQKIFSFQIAQRDQFLDLPMTSLWHPILLETFSDNVASKMVALVDRGAPRDFVDIYELARRDLLSLGQCWNLYLQKRPDADLESAKQQVLEHLERIAARRPLDSITNPVDRSYSGLVRHWYYEHFGHTEDLNEVGL